MRGVLWRIVFIVMGSAVVMGADYEKEVAQVLGLGELVDAPVVRDGDGEVVGIGAGDLKAVYFDGLVYEGKGTRVYAWVGVPEGASVKRKVPGVVLVHGGGGTAFKAWVEKWLARGYAAISIAVEGQVDVRVPREPGARRGRWERHAWAGPARVGIYGDSERPIEEQWMYHAVADVVLANSLLRSLPEVDGAKVGVVGISWGGIIASTVIGIDDRFAFGIPTYGCGNMSQAGNQYGRALGDNEIYKQVWDPILRLEKAKMPTLWLSWPGDQHFPLDKQASCYGAVSGPYMVSLIPGMRHGHQPGWNPLDSYAFADGVVADGKPWGKHVSSEVEGGRFVVVFESVKPLDGAVLVSTVDGGITGDRVWGESDVVLERVGEVWVVSGMLPEGTTGWFVNVKVGALTLSSDYVEME